MSNWYAIRNVSSLDSPALVVYPERVKQNIRRAIEMTGDLQRLRPHVKTHKSPQATEALLAEGIDQFKCATIAEAEMLAKCKARDVLLAYQPVGPKVTRFLQLIKKFPETRFGCLTDTSAAASLLSDAFSREGCTVPVYIDLNLGMNRTGISPDEGAAALYKALHAMKGIQPMGFHAYDGHYRQADINKRTAACNTAFERVEALIKHLEESGYTVPVVIAGGSPTFPIHAKRKDVICSPGTFIYWDKGYGDLCQEQPFQHAAALITRVISLPAANRICTDLGHKSVAAENEIGKRVFFPEHPSLKAVGQSEEHLVLEVPEGHSFKVGDVLYGIPYHICPTVALYERAYTVENGEWKGFWNHEARDRFLSI